MPDGEKTNLAPSDTGTAPHKRVPPTRGSLRLEASVSNPEVTSGSDFSIFVTIHNPFDVPVTVYDALTHIPIELVDINGLRVLNAKKQRTEVKSVKEFFIAFTNVIKSAFWWPSNDLGIAIALGTELPADVQREMIRSEIRLGNIQDITGRVTVAGISISLPENADAEDLDRIFHHIDTYAKGTVPVTLQPGDNIVRQFVLRTRKWLLFTPLSYTFRIQVNYSSDGVDHFVTIPYHLNIRLSLASIIIGSIFGAVMGSLLKNFDVKLAAGADPGSLLQAMIVAIIAGTTVVIAFARKATAQSIVSVEDFWGGTLIGFSVGFFGFEQFFYLFNTKPET